MLLRINHQKYIVYNAAMGDDDKCEGEPINIEMDFNTPAAARCDIFNGGERPSVKILDDKYYLEEVLENSGPNRINLPKEQAFVSRSRRL